MQVLFDSAGLPGWALEVVTWIATATSLVLAVAGLVGAVALLLGRCVAVIRAWSELKHPDRVLTDVSAREKVRPPV